LLRVCSETLRKLEIDLREFECNDDSDYLFECNDCSDSLFFSPPLELSPVPPNIQRLTIRTEILACHRWCLSNLPAAAEVVNQIVLPPGDLILDIDITLYSDLSDLTTIDISPLSVLGAASLSIARINLYVHTGILQPAITRAQLTSMLEIYEDILRAVKAGVLVIHPGKNAPDT